MVNWNVVFGTLGDSTVTGFANGNVSGNQLTKLARFTPANGEVRTLLRKDGVAKAKLLARKACRSRKLL